MCVTLCYGVSLVISLIGAGVPIIYDDALPSILAFEDFLLKEDFLVSMDEVDFLADLTSGDTTSDFLDALSSTAPVFTLDIFEPCLECLEGDLDKEFV